MCEVLVSVVIPAYNAGAFVADGIDGVLTQSHQNLELILVDDGSTDRTGEIAESFDDPPLCVVRQSNAGPSRARNHGLALATGDFVAFLDADQAEKERMRKCTSSRLLEDHAGRTVDPGPAATR